MQQSDLSQLSDKQFQQMLSKRFYKSTAKQIGELAPKIQATKAYGNNGRFTDHLLASGMVRNASLNTTVEREKFVEGSKDWMQHLN